MSKRTETALELGLTHIITISDDGTTAHSYRVSPVYGSGEQEDIEVPATGDEADEITGVGRTRQRADIVRRLVKRWRGGGSFAIMMTALKDGTGDVELFAADVTVSRGPDAVPSNASGERIACLYDRDALPPRECRETIRVNAEQINQLVAKGAKLV